MTFELCYSRIYVSGYFYRIHRNTHMNIYVVTETEWASYSKDCVLFYWSLKGHTIDAKFLRPKRIEKIFTSKSFIL